MKRGRLKTVKNILTKKYEIHGKLANGIWDLVTIEGRPLIFPLEYDCCAFLLAWYEWVQDHKTSINASNLAMSKNKTNNFNRKKRRILNKIAKKSRKRKK